MIEQSFLSVDTLVGRVVRLPLKLIPKNWSVPILQGPLRGKRWIVGSQRHAFWLGCYEPEMQRLIARDISPGAVFYDIGANVGFYSLLASRLIAPGKVIAFEPLPINVSYLRRHLDLNRCRNVEVLEVAACDQEGEANFEQEATLSMGRLDNQGNLRVRTSSLDALLHGQEIPPPNYVKMDIEGAEFRALLGAEECFRKYKPTLFLATHGRDVHENCCKLLRSWNFRLEPIRQQSDDRAELIARPVDLQKRLG
jgi:FkbM family methyltransferase